MIEKRPPLELPVTLVDTVEVENPAEPGTFMLINKADFDPGKHKAFEPPVPEGDNPQTQPAGSKKDKK